MKKIILFLLIPIVTFVYLKAFADTTVYGTAIYPNTLLANSPLAVSPKSNGTTVIHYINNIIKYGSICFNSEESGYDATMALTTSYSGFINGNDDGTITPPTNGVTFVEDNVNGDYLLIGVGSGGYYFIHLTTSFEGTTPNRDVHCDVFQNATETRISWETEVSSASVTIEGSSSGYLNISDADKIRIKCNASASTDVNIKHLNLAIFRVSGV